MYEKTVLNHLAYVIVFIKKWLVKKKETEKNHIFFFIIKYFNDPVKIEDLPIYMIARTSNIYG